jgi:hypothetical protein
VAADSVYGVGEIETALRRAGKGYVLGVNGSHLSNAWGDKPLVVGTAEAIAQALPATAWARLSAGEDTKGPRLYDRAYLELADLEAAEYDDSLSGLWTRGLLIRRSIAKEIWLQAGNIGDDSYSEDDLENKAEAGYSTRPTSRGAKAAGNNGTLIVGQHFKRYCKQQPTPVEGAAIYQHDGEVEMAPEDCVAWYKDVVNKPESKAPADWDPLPRPIQLSMREVGPSAK